ncbi:MAG TPA: PfkB family carbohydrate kinase [Tepidisphaeraceae bacterium]|jgi:rfaE bifunctional protein kinase chain/domain/rfaE bifunctional protein nucleotidyltransferase chain/domain
MLSNRKVLSLESLVSLREQARAAGKTVVHCHGCFDIVHPGHIHHLQYARSLGDVLVVSVSADPHVNKGHDRPLIPDDLRAQSLAALECVDWVYVNPQATARELLDVLQPDVYVKGREYEETRDPRFLAERDIVVRHGGRVVFSSGDVVYSSTALIGTLTRPERFQDEKLARFRDRYGLGAAPLQNLLHRARGKRVLVVGDYILDRYHFCDATGVAGEGPMLSLRPIQQRDYDGGAAVVALHLAGLGAQPMLISALADDDLSGQIAMRLEAAGIDVQCHSGRREIVCKHRYLADQTKLFKVDSGSTTPGDAQLEGLLAAKILSAADGADAVIFTDFGYGMITAGLLGRVLPDLRKRVPVLAADVSGHQSNLLHFRGVDLLCPTEREVREAQHDFTSGLGAVVWKMLKSTGARRAIITLGKQGLVTFDGTEQPLPPRLPSEYVPALAPHAIDPLGCGDALLATATLALTTGGSLEAAAFLGAIAAAIEVQELGNQPITAEQILAQLQRSQAISAAA